MASITAGELLSALFDERLMKKAKGYSKLFDCWADITQKNGIAAAADHSRIKELYRGILLIETDHPGWKQIIQTKQSQLLNDFRRRFPDMDISGISLILGRNDPHRELSREPSAENSGPQPREEPEEPFKPGYEEIKDEAFKESLRRLEQSITERENG
jgi:hypothetical protein